MKRRRRLLSACMSVVFVFFALASQGISQSSYPPHMAQEQATVTAPTLISPINDSDVFKGPSAVFVWSGVNDALEYMMSMSQTPDFSKQTKLLGDNKGAMNQTTISFPKNKPEGEYYWRARASNKSTAQMNKDSDWGPWSTVGTFILGTPTYNMADYYPLSVGNQWNYTNGQEKITGTIEINNENVFITQNSLCDCGRDDYLTVDERGILYWGNSEEGILAQPLVMFEPTWKIGEKKPLTAPPAAAMLKLEGLEDVTTPAGQFKNCLRFYFSVSINKGGKSQHYKEVLHLAKGVGPVRTQRLKGSSPHSGCFLGIEDVCCPTCSWTQELVSAVINGTNIP
jgi:hypothetical protein